MATSAATADEREPKTRVIMWSTPRSVSTAFEKCMSFVEDSVIWHEPYISAMWFGKDKRFEVPRKIESSDDLKAKDYEAEAEMYSDVNGFVDEDTSYSWCQQQLEAHYPGKRLLFCKEIVHTIDTKYDFIPRGFRHVFLVRHPMKVFPSWKRLLQKVFKIPLDAFKLHEIPESGMPKGFSFKEQFELYEYVKKHHDVKAIILDADDLLSNPPGMMKAYCDAVGIPYSDGLLKWPAGDAITSTWYASKFIMRGNIVAGYYKAALESSCFGKAREMPSREELSADELLCVDASMEYYDKLYEQRLKC